MIVIGFSSVEYIFFRSLSVESDLDMVLLVLSKTKFN